MFIGLQASGKSSFYQERFTSSHVQISKDHFPNAKNQDQRQLRLLEHAIEQGQSVVIDNTNPRVSDRSDLIAVAKSHGGRVIGFCFESKMQDCLDRNRHRTGRARVPDVALFSTINVLDWPTLAEGFDVLFSVSILNQGFVVAPFEVRL